VTVWLFGLFRWAVEVRVAQCRSPPEENGQSKKNARAANRQQKKVCNSFTWSKKERVFSFFSYKPKKPSRLIEAFVFLYLVQVTSFWVSVASWYVFDLLYAGDPNLSNRFPRLWCNERRRWQRRQPFDDVAHVKRIYRKALPLALMNQVVLPLYLLALSPDNDAATPHLLRQLWSLPTTSAYDNTTCLVVGGADDDRFITSLGKWSLQLVIELGAFYGKLQVFATLSSIAYALGHMALHRYKLLYRLFHAAHHDFRCLVSLSASADSFTETALTTLSNMSLVWAIGFAKWQVAIILVMLNHENISNHCGYGLEERPASMHHELHHAYRNCNFADDPYIDRFFGTLRLVADEKNKDAVAS
jgi:sterol desaturase/sphingolipid hydroxylase (fatty acid hydroxylase superfamily)